MSPLVIADQHSICYDIIYLLGITAGEPVMSLEWGDQKLKHSAKEAP